MLRLSTHVREAAWELVKLYMFLVALVATGLFRPSGLDWLLASAVAVAFALILSPLYRSAAPANDGAPAGNGDSAAGQTFGPTRRIGRGRLYGTALVCASLCWLALHLATAAHQARNGGTGFEVDSVWVVLAFVILAIVVAGALERVRNRNS